MCFDAGDVRLDTRGFGDDINTIKYDLWNHSGYDINLIEISFAIEFDGVGSDYQPSTCYVSESSAITLKYGYLNTYTSLLSCPNGTKGGFSYEVSDFVFNGMSGKRPFSQCSSS